MDVLFCSSEAFPLVKTGGLGDVCGSLPKALCELGNDVRLVLPAYPRVREQADASQTIASLALSSASEPVQILRGRLPDSDVALYLVDSPEHFQRPGNPYLQQDGLDWPDNAERFAVFARAIVALSLGEADASWKPELVHCNDWQTGLVPALLSVQESPPATLFSIHNLSYQGLFPATTFSTLGLPGSLWSMDGLEFNNMLSFLKGGIAKADWVTTVSPTYAAEICTSEFGYGLEGLLRYRSGNLTGILNGIDTETWNPASDTHIERSYDVHSLQHKVVNKFAMQREHGLPVGSQPLLLAHIGRLVEQKGADLILDSLDNLFQHPIQMVILGSGEQHLQQRLMDAADRYPAQLAVHVGYDEQMAHRIQAGADCLLIPSRYEPCGLNQMYSMAYGTIPIAHRTGGLVDTIVNLDEDSGRDYTATGFTFDEDNPEALVKSCLRALNQFQHHRIDWWKLAITGMKQDFSWSRSATRYFELYKHIRRSAPARAATGTDGDAAATSSQAVSA